METRRDFVCVCVCSYSFLKFPFSPFLKDFWLQVKFFSLSQFPMSFREDSCGHLSLPEILGKEKVLTTLINLPEHCHSRYSKYIIYFKASVLCQKSQPCGVD